jgi:hypothetical protein
MESLNLSNPRLLDRLIFFLFWERENCGKADTIPTGSIVFLQPFISGKWPKEE